MKDRKGNKLKVGDCVIWYDPNESLRDTTRIWTIDRINGEVVTISDNYSEAETYPSELEKIIVKNV